MCGRDSLADLQAAYAGKLRELDQPCYDNLRQFVHEDGERALVFDVTNDRPATGRVWGIAATTIGQYYTFWESKGPNPADAQSCVLTRALCGMRRRRGGGP